MFWKRRSSGSGKNIQCSCMFYKNGLLGSNHMWVIFLEENYKNSYKIFRISACHMWNHNFLVLLSKRARTMAPSSPFLCPHAVKICQKEAILLSIYSLSLYNSTTYISHISIAQAFQRCYDNICLKCRTQFTIVEVPLCLLLWILFHKMGTILSQSCNPSFLNSGARAGGRHARETGSQGLLRHQRR